MELGYTTFETGDHFVEWFYTDRWYNIMEVRGAGDRLKGWYCNVTYPAEFQPDHISYRDLALDLWVAPDGATLTLDEDEFDADPAIDAHARAQALAALGRLRELVARRLAPFDALPG
jgi:protein associated with RNAse G/E